MNDSHEAVERVFQQLVIPHGKRLDSISMAEWRFIHDWIKDHQLNATLEIGMAFGASASSILSAHQGGHICIDPYQEKNYQNAGLENLERLGYRDRVQLFQDFSCNALPKLFSEKAQVDFIFIDGDHRFDSVFVDFYYSDLLLANKGYILFHDSWMRGIQLVASCMSAIIVGIMFRFAGRVRILFFFKRTGRIDHPGILFTSFTRCAEFCLTHWYAPLFAFSTEHKPLKCFNCPGYTIFSTDLLT